MGPGARGRTNTPAVYTQLGPGARTNTPAVYTQAGMEWDLGLEDKYTNCIYYTHQLEWNGTWG